MWATFLACQFRDLHFYSQQTSVGHLISYLIQKLYLYGNYFRTVTSPLRNNFTIQIKCDYIRQYLSHIVRLNTEMRHTCSFSFIDTKSGRNFPINVPLRFSMCLWLNSILTMYWKISYEFESFDKITRNEVKMLEPRRSTEICQPLPKTICISRSKAILSDHRGKSVYHPIKDITYYELETYLMLFIIRNNNVFFFYYSCFTGRRWCRRWRGSG